MAKFARLREKKGYLDCLKFAQATLSSGGQNGSTNDKRVQINAKNPDIDNARRSHENNPNSRGRSVGNRRQPSNNTRQGSQSTLRPSLRENLQPILTGNNHTSFIQGPANIIDDSILQENLNNAYELSDEAAEEEQMAVVSKQECMSPGYIIRRQRSSIESFAWDPNYASDVIQIGSQNRSVFLKEEAYLFRTVIANKSFNEGIHYWEIVADARSENEIKIGVTKNREFDLKTAFCDYSFGWAYYAVGQLRHCDGANGQTFGSK